MKRYLMKLAWLAIVVPNGCGMVACVDQETPDEELSSTEAEVVSAWCVDHACADLVVRVLKDNYYTRQVELGDACSINGTGVLVGNHGKMNAPATTLTVYTPSTGIKKGYSIPALSPGFSYLLPVTVPKNSTVFADAYDVVDEGSESNQYKFYCI